MTFINWCQQYWHAHGTKILGALSAGLASLTSILATLTALPQTQVLLTPTHFAYLAAGNAVLGAMTIRRGFTNSRQT